MVKQKSMQSKGGDARAAALTPVERSEIARTAAATRWGIPQASHSGKLEIGNSSIDCYVLEKDGEVLRILSTRGVMKALGRTWRGRKYSGTKLPVFLEAKNLKPYIDKDLEAVLTPISFRTDKGMMSEGYNAEMFPKVCEVFLKADDADALVPSQYATAKQADILIRALATVGIIALVDEVTNYQEVRDRFALRAIVNKYITDEWAKWSKTFPNEFYEELFRLKGISLPLSAGSKKPSYVGHWTNDIVYSRLAPGVLTELRRVNPVISGARKHKFFQYLTTDIGNPALREHLTRVIFLMRACSSYQEFQRLLNRAAQKFGDTIPMDL